MIYQPNPKEKYLYETYFSSMKGASITEVPFVEYRTVSICSIDPTYTLKDVADRFMADTASKESHIDDLFGQKLSLTRDRSYLILNEIQRKEDVHQSNLARLYDDLFMIEKWQSERPYPENYLKDKTWMELNRMQLQIHDQIRRELKDSIRSISFNEKDLRDALLDFKKQSQKNVMMTSLLEDEINDRQEINTIAGDTYRM